MKDKKFPYGSVEIGGKKIPLKKNGTPNKQNLTKDLKEVYDEWEKDEKESGRKIKAEELKKVLQKAAKK